MEQLLPEEEALFDCLREHLLLHRYSPSIKEIKSLWGKASTSKLQALLEQLREKGYIDWDSRKARTYRLIAGNMPLRGAIQAGYIFEQPLFSSYIDVQGPQYKPQDYALEVKGDSMKDAHICDGDFVILRPVQQIDNLTPGTITAVWVEEEVGTTLKHVYYKGDRVVLKPANRNYEPRMYPADHVHPQGVLVGLHRSYRK